MPCWVSGSVVASQPRRFVFGEHGVSMLELTIGLPLLIIIVAGLVEVGFSLHNGEVVADAARHGAITAAKVAADNPVTCATLTAQALQYTVGYLQGSGLDPAEWEIGPLKLPQTPGPEVVNFVEDVGTPNELAGQAIKVSLTSIDGTECLLCWQNLFSGFTVSAESTFVLEAPCT